MPIIFVHGVSSRKYNNHEKTWKEIEENLKEHVAPALFQLGGTETTSIKNVFWGELSVPLYKGMRKSIPDEARVIKLIEQKRSWIARKIEQLKHTPNPDKIDFLLGLIPEGNQSYQD